MRSDTLAFKKATSASLAGIGLQGFLSLLILLYGVIADDGIGTTAFYASGIGVFVWLALVLLFHQHKLERIEAAEADAFAASSAAQSSVFDEYSEELRVAARRLSWMHRLLMPIISVVIGALSIGIGIWQFLIARSDLDLVTFIPATEYSGWAVAIGLAVAVIGFVFARFIAGMAKQEVWANLRAGSGAIVWLSLMSMVLAIAHGADFVGIEQPLQYARTIIAASMILIGVEVLLNFLLNMYRPRRAGEIPRPAFDSKIMSFVAAPDRIASSINEAINYQFGSDVASTWFYRLLSRTFPRLLLLAMVIVWGLTCFTVVGPSEKGMVIRFGRMVRAVESGLVIKAPWPISRVERHHSGRAQQLNSGTPHAHNDRPILWTTKHTDGDDRLLLVQPTARLNAGGDATGDLSLMAVEVPIIFTIDDVEKYSQLAADGRNEAYREVARINILHSVATSEVMRFISTLGVDDLLGERREAINNDLRQRLEERLNSESGLDAGIRIAFAGIVAAHPPRDDDVAMSFESVVSADLQQSKMIEDARMRATQTLAETAGSVDQAEEIVVQLRAREAMSIDDQAAVALDQRIEQLLDNAGGDAAAIILQARADRWEKLLRYKSNAIRQASRIAGYQAAPRVYTARLYFETLVDAIRETRLYITTADAPEIRFDLTEIQSSFDAFNIESATRE